MGSWSGRVACSLGPNSQIKKIRLEISGNVKIQLREIGILLYNNDSIVLEK